MTNIEIVQLVMGSGGFIGVLILIFRAGKIVQKIETLAVDLSSLKAELKKDLSSAKEDIKKDILVSHEDIKIIKSHITGIEIQIAKLETRLEERTLRLHYESNKTIGE